MANRGPIALTFYMVGHLWMGGMGATARGVTGLADIPDAGELQRLVDAIDGDFDGGATDYQCVASWMEVESEGVWSRQYRLLRQFQDEASMGLFSEEEEE